MENKGSHPEMFFHLGLGKVASTYLQYAFFPKLKDIYYIQRTRYRFTPNIVAKQPAQRFFVSREMDQQLEAEVIKFAQNFPETKAILLLRRHDSWIASQYRRHVKNGSPMLFEDFFDVEKDTGWWPKSEVNFFDKIQIIEKHFKYKPLVLFHDELKEDPYLFMDRIAQYLGASYNRNEVSLSAIHKSYNEQQLKVMRKVSRMLFRKTPVFSKNRIFNWFQRRGRLLLCYLILYSALIVPKSWVVDEELVSAEAMKKVRDAYDQDWQKCLEYAQQHNPV